MTATDAQVRIIMREREKGRTLEQAAASANLRSRKTAAKYEQLGKLPSELNQPRRYRTRCNPFEEDWPTVKAKLEDAPSLEAKALFEWLCEQHPGRYQEGQLRTFQRHVATWRALNQKQVAILEQVHRPGEVLQTDGTWFTKLGVTIQGQPFKHLLIQLVKLGHVPKYHRTDNSGAATYWPGAKAQTNHKREYTDGYLLLLEHYGLEPQTTNLDSPHENGDVESLHGGLKRAIKQYLLLRGSHDFESIEAYEDFLFDVMQRRNRSREERLAEEMAVMKPLDATPLAANSQVRVRVTQGSLIRVQKNVYSVPTSLIGRWVTVRIHEWRLDVYYQTHLVVTLPRLIGEKQHLVNYRHVIDSLIRKPGGFRDYRYRDDLFPSLVFRRAWEQLNQWQSPRKADITYLRILRLAARKIESDVAAALERLLATAGRWDETNVEHMLQPEPIRVPHLTCGQVHLHQYDQLLSEVCHGA
jgi:hypothetical protein